MSIEILVQVIDTSHRGKAQQKSVRAMKGAKGTPHELSVTIKRMKGQDLFINMTNDGSKSISWSHSAHRKSFGKLPGHIGIHEVPERRFHCQVIASPSNIGP